MFAVAADGDGACFFINILDSLNFAAGKILLGGKSPRKCIYSVPAQEVAKHRAKFGWPPVSHVAAVSKARRESR